MSNFTTFNYPASGLNNVAEYMASGLPWVTSSVASTSPYTYNFPYVTSTIQVQNSGSMPLRLGFTQNGVNGSNFYVVPSGGSLELDVRVITLYVRAESGTTNYSIFAGLTQIPTRGFPVLTGSAAGFNPATTSSIYGYAGIG